MGTRRPRRVMFRYVTKSFTLAPKGPNETRGEGAAAPVKDRSLHTIHPHNFRTPLTPGNARRNKS